MDQDSPRLDGQSICCVSRTNRLSIQSRRQSICCVSRTNRPIQRLQPNSRTEDSRKVRPDLFHTRRNRSKIPRRGAQQAGKNLRGPNPSASDKQSLRPPPRRKPVERPNSAVECVAADKSSAHFSPPNPGGT